MPGTGIGLDLGTTGGSWLFKQGGMLLGPAPAKVIIEMLYKGELTGQTPLSQDGEGFRRLSEVEFFRVHLAKAEAKLKVEAVAKSKQASERRTRTVRLTIWSTVGLAVAVGGALSARWLAVNKPWQQKLDIDVPNISMEMPQITVASARSRGLAADDDLEYPEGESTSPGGKPSGARPTKPSAMASAAAPRKGAVEGDALTQPKFDQGVINAIVAKNQKSLYPCLIEEARKQPGLAAKIPVEFAIGNDGRVAKLWIDNPQFKNGLLAACMLKKLQEWKFPSYEGERATVSLKFNIGG